MYTNNPKMPKIRRDTVLSANKYGVRCAARHFGFSPGAIVLWKKRAKEVGLHPIPTRSSRPKRSPRGDVRHLFSAIGAYDLGQSHHARKAWQVIQDCW
jgi:hypothetical protein